MTTTPRTIAHKHVPLHRVIRSGWVALDTSYSQQAAADNRWNTPDFPALYSSCSIAIATTGLPVLSFGTSFVLAGIELADLQDVMLPQLVEIAWAGEVVDVASSEGVAAAGFPPDYPIGIDKTQTRVTARIWHDGGAAGVVGRSASLMRLGLRSWDGDHESWSETTVFVSNSSLRPTVQRRRTDLDWLAPSGTVGGA